MSDQANKKRIDKGETNKALFKNTGIIAIGQMATKIVNFLLLPLYTTLLSQQEYGIIDLLTTYCSVIVLIIGLQMNQAVFRFLITCREDRDKCSEYISTILVTLVVVCGLYGVIFFLLYPFINLDYKWYLLVHSIASLVLQTVSGIARGLGKNANYAMGNFMSAAISLVLNVVFIAVLRWGVSSMLMAYIIGPVVGIVFQVVKTKIHTYVQINKWNKKCLREVLNYSLPLIPNELSWSIIHASDRIVVSTFLSIAVNGLIAVASKFSVIYTTVFSVFNASWTEQVVLHYKDEGGPEYVCMMFDRMVTFFGCIAIGIIASMPVVFPILVNSQFSEAYQLVPVYMIAVFFNAVIGMISAIYLIENETKRIAISTLVAAGINLIVDLVLIKRIGAFAAPVSSLAGYTVISLWRLYDINRRHCRIMMPLQKVVSLLTMLVISIVGFSCNNLILSVILLVVLFMVSVIMNKEILFGFLKIRRKNKKINE